MSDRPIKAATIVVSLCLLAAAVALPLTAISQTESTQADQTLVAQRAAPVQSDLSADEYAVEVAGADTGDWADWHSSEDLPSWYHDPSAWYTDDLAPYYPAGLTAEGDGSTDESQLSPQQQRGRGQARGQTRGRGRGRGGRGRRGGGMRGVYRTSVSANWFADNTKFWYRNSLRGGTSEFILVDAKLGTRMQAFDHAKLAAALADAADQEVSGDRLPFNRIEFNEDASAVSFTFAEGEWSCDLASYECSRTGDAPAVAQDENAGDGAFGQFDPQRRGRGARGQRGQRGGRGGRGGFGGGRGGRSPDGNWIATVRDGNIYLRPAEGDETDEIQLSQDGTEQIGYRNLNWAPDSKTLVAFHTEPGDRLEVHLIQSSPPGDGRAVYSSRPYPLPGDKFTSYELNLFDAESKKQTEPNVDPIDFGQPRLRWADDGHSFSYQKVDRGHQRFRIINVDSHTGETFNIIDEQTETFIWTAHTESLGLGAVNWLENTDEIIWASEQDGWRHLYLVDSKGGGIKNQITRGEFVVRGIDRIDEENRQIWFRASGRNPDQDPYLIHYYRINFDGTYMVALTAGNGNHSITYSPDQKYIIDSYNRVDMPGVTELRRVGDGQLVCELEKADMTELEESGNFRPIEVFVAKGRDNETDIWGVITRPRDFDPEKKYPVIESIYAGPQGSFVPKSFGNNRYAALADEGYIVVQIDGMGTANRSKAFHDVCWHDLKDAGFPDRIQWMQAAAEKYPYMDIARVGAYGTSAGGQNAMGAVLFHPEFYKAAVANCGCHDNRMDKASWNEQWMGYPVGPQYAESSNVDNAYRLQGALFLIVGEMDTNVPPESTMRVVDALIQSNRQFDLLVVPNGGHGAGNAGAYHNRKLRDFFALHLQGIPTPNRNAEGPGNPPGSGGNRGRGRGAGVGAVIRPAATIGELRAASASTPTEIEFASPLVQEAEQPATEQPAPADQQVGTEDGPTRQPEGDAAAPSAAPLDLTGLQSRDTRTSRIVARYRADRSSLTRFYLAGDSPNTRARMRRFYIDWLAALGDLPSDDLSDREREEIDGLKADIAEQFAALAKEGRADAPLAPLLPFADTIYQLVEDRLAVKPMDAREAAGQVDSISRQISAVQSWVESKLEGDTQDGTPLTRDALTRAAERTGQLRQQLQRWHSFYEGYDPLFDWWMRAPYDEATKSLDSYAVFLNEQSEKVDATAERAGSSPSPAGLDDNPARSPAVALIAPAGPPGSDVPDLLEILNEPRGYMELVMQRYQSETGRGRRGRRGGRGARGGQRGPAAAARDVGDDQSDNASQAADGAQEETGQGPGEGARGDEQGDTQVAEEAGAGQGEPGRGRGRRGGQFSGRGGRGGGQFAGRGGNAPDAREHATRWLAALEKLDFDSFSRADKVDYLLLKTNLQRQLAAPNRRSGRAGGGGGRGGRGGEPLDESGIPGRPVGRDALVADLAREMIDYTPEQLIEIGRREMDVCRVEMIKASREMGLGDDWMAAVEKVKNMHVPPGEQPQLIRDLAWEAIDYLRANDLITIPNVAAETWGMRMMSPQQQLVNPFFTGGSSISVSYPTDTMSHDAKLQSMRGNNIPFARATVHHELIPGHNLQGYMSSRYNTHRRGNSTPFWGEGWALYWELTLYERGFAKTPEDRIGFLVWRSHRCARIVFSLSFHMGQMLPQECVDYLVANVGFDRKNAEGEVRRSFGGSYSPLYQAAYLLGGLQLRQLHREVVEAGKMSEREFHDTIIRGGSMPIKMVRLLVSDVPLTRDEAPEWKFYGPVIVTGAGAAAGQSP